MTDRELMQQAHTALSDMVEDGDATDKQQALVAIAALRERLAREEPKRPPNCGTGYCSCIECVMEPARQEQPDELTIWKARAMQAEAVIAKFMDEPARQEQEQTMLDAIIGGTGIMQGGKRIDPESVRQEPVAWMIWTHGPVLVFINKNEAELEFERLCNAYPEQSRKLLPLYTAPQPREWVGLTDQEAKETFTNKRCIISADLAGVLARAIEAKLREKNA